MFKDELWQQMSNPKAAQSISDKIEEDKMDMDATKDDIDDRENSAINEILTDKSFDNHHWNEFCNIVNKNIASAKAHNSQVTIMTMRIQIHMLEMN